MKKLLTLVVTFLVLAVWPLLRSARAGEGPPRGLICDLAISKKVNPTPLVTGQPAVVTISVTNVGTGPCPGPTNVWEEPPFLGLMSGSGWNCPSSPGNACAYPNPIAAHASAPPLTFTFNVPPPGPAPSPPITNCVAVENSNDHNPGNNRACVTTPVVTQAAKCDLEIKKSISPTPLVSAQPATITITVTNVGKAPCQGVTTVTDGPLTWLRVVSVAQGGSLWNCSTAPPNPGATVTCTWNASIQPVPPGPLPTITITGNVTAKPGSSVTNCATVTNVNDTNPANNQSCVTVPVSVSPTQLPDLTIKKQVSCPGPATPQGIKCTITFTITNNGPGTFNGILGVQDVLTPTPSSLSFALPSGSTPPGWSCALPLPLDCATTGPVTLAPPGSTTFSVDVYVPTGQYTNCATVSELGVPVSNQNDSNPGNNRACVTTSVVTQVGENEVCASFTMDLSTGVANWSVNPGPMHTTTPLSVWAPIAGATWIQPANSSTPQVFPDGGNYQYKVPFNLPQPSLYSSVTITGQYAADDTATLSMAGGTCGVGSCSCTSSVAPYCFSSAHSFTITQTSSIPASNTLDVTVHNFTAYSGLIVQAKLNAICKR